jgi:hypothetical protein
MTLVVQTSPCNCSDPTLGDVYGLRSNPTYGSDRSRLCTDHRSRQNAPAKSPFALAIWRWIIRVRAAVEKDMFEGQTRATFVPLRRNMWHFSTGLRGSEIAFEEVD